MKTKTILMITAVVGLSACASMKREAYIAPNATQNVTTEKNEKLTKVLYSKKYYDSAIKITDQNAEEKLAKAKFPTPVLISGTVKDSLNYKDRASIGKLKGINWLGGTEYKGGYMFNGKTMFVTKFPTGSSDYKTINQYSADQNVTDLFCIASEVTGDDAKLMTQDLIYFATNPKEKLSPLLKSNKKTSDGKPVYINFTDCAFVKTN